VSISNCYIYGARNNILSKAYLTLSNSILADGSLSNIHAISGSLTIENVTTIQNVRTFTYTKPDESGTANAKVVGFGVLVGPTPEYGVTVESNPPITINGTFTQYNWLCSNDVSGITSSKIAPKLMESALSKTEYIHKINGTNYVNMGIVYLNNTASTLVDNRTDHGYQLGTVNYSIVSGQVYSLTSANGTVQNQDSYYLSESTTNGLYVPLYRIIDLPTTDPVTNPCCWNDGGTIIITIPLGESYSLNILDYIDYYRYTEENVTTTVSCENATVQGNIITFRNTGFYEIILTVSGASVYDQSANLTSHTQYSFCIPVNVAVTMPNMRDAEIVVDTSVNTSGVKINSSGDVYYWFDIFDGLTLYDYDMNGNRELVLDGSNTNSKKNFVAKIVAMDPGSGTDLVNGNYGSTSQVVFTLNDGRTLELHFSAISATNTPGTSNGGPRIYLTTDSSKNTIYFGTANAANKSNSSSTGARDRISAKTFYARWTISGYKFKGNSGNTVTSSSSHTVSTGLYNGTWYTPSTGTRPTTNFSPSLKYTVTFNVNADNGFCAQETISTTASGQSITLPVAMRDGFEFKGWYNASSGGTRVGGAGDSYAPTATITLYAQWKAQFTVTFDSDGASSISPIRDFSGTVITLPNPVKDGWYLIGWFDGETRVGGAGDSYTIPEQNITLIAQWGKIYTVIYNANGGTVSTENATYEGTALILPKPTNGAKTFEGWFTAVEGGTLIGMENDSYVPAADIELFAQWSDNILVTFDGNGGTSVINKATYDFVTPITLPSATWAGHQLNGWFTAASGGTKVGDAGSSYAPSEPITLYAQWTAYVVSFDGNGVTNPSSLTAESDGTVTLPTPTRTGYTFNGWYSETSGGSKIGDGGASYTPTADITLHAQWTVNSYKVTITTSNSTTAVTVNGTTVNNGGSVAYNSVVKVVLSYSQSNSLTFTIKQGNTNVTRYSDEACTTSTTSNDAGTYYFKMPAGEVTITSSSDSGCVAAGTLITLADGSQKPVEEIEIGEMVMTYSFFTGTFEAMPVIILESGFKTITRVLTLHLDNDMVLEIVADQSFYDVNSKEYFNVDANNYLSQIGKTIMVEKNGHISSSTIVDITVEERSVQYFELNTAVNYNFFANGVMTNAPVFFNILLFDVNENDVYDEESMQHDIETYGLFDYNLISDFVSKEVFDAMNGQYLSIALGKGLITYELLYQRLAKLAELEVIN
jgi:uncharacterized repeat protein (TIGR02543 family)